MRLLYQKTRPSGSARRCQPLRLRGVETAGEDSRPAPPTMVESLSSGSSGGVLYCWVKASTPPPADQVVGVGGRPDRPGGSDVLSGYIYLSVSKTARRVDEMPCSAAGVFGFGPNGGGFKDEKLSNTRKSMLTKQGPFLVPCTG